MLPLFRQNIFLGDSSREMPKKSQDVCCPPAARGFFRSKAKATPTPSSFRSQGFLWQHPGYNVILLGGALAKNIFWWQVADQFIVCADRCAHGGHIFRPAEFCSWTDPPFPVASLWGWARPKIMQRSPDDHRVEPTHARLTTACQTTD